MSTKIGVLSDTHADLPKDIAQHLQDCDEIWHAGDIGSLAVTDRLSSLALLRAVHGNIDSAIVRQLYPKELFFTCEGLRILITHITGTPPYYNREVEAMIKQHQPHILVGGHTHILRIERDKNGLLYLNPGALGNHGIHPKRTLVRFEIEQASLRNMRVIEIGKSRY